MAAAGSEQGAGAAFVKNGPAQCPPRDLQLAPSRYLPPQDHALVTAVTTVRPAEIPLSSLLAYGESSGNRSAGRKSLFAKAKAKVPDKFVFNTCVARLRSAEEQGGGGNILAADCGSAVAAYPLPDGSNTAKTRETCKFTADKQQQLLELRRRMSSFQTVYKDLCDMISGGPLECGLPRLQDSSRCRLRGNTFSLEDAKKELCNEWYLKRLGSFVDFIDHALADDLDALVDLPAESTYSSGGSSLLDLGAQRSAVRFAPDHEDLFEAVSKLPGASQIARKMDELDNVNIRADLARGLPSGPSRTPRIGPPVI
eukprot:TRINITY_DN21034_c0_g1_i1.p1 TRINITY_DN21034_c0_g1~~TRINITY_DN21034_c0_g1_i1.p1  ORF type:complete len:325 (+),score=71.78 TRINITY_DN21034_c0_g1_i1:40-975(+)